MKTTQLFPGGSLSFSSNGNYAGAHACRGQVTVVSAGTKSRAEGQPSFEEMLLREFGARPVAKTGLSGRQTQSVDPAASIMDALAAQSLWDFWA